MKIPGRSRHALFSCAVLLVVLPALQARAHTTHNDAWAREKFAAAERTREALNGRPAAERTRRDYQRALDAYRRVYFGAPSSTKADPSVVAVAELLVEMGRRFDDAKILRSAIQQYQFLRREYPGSKYRFDALFTIGEIYKDDLDDPDQARGTFEEFLHHYPRNRLVDDARQALNEISEAEAQQKEAAKKESDTAPKRETKDATSRIARDESRKENEGASAQSKSGTLPRVTGIRHWSTPEYTRVAIDLEQEIKFESQRIANPDRIFFDLHDTKLASTLVGKSFDVDDGFLRKIRVAQFQRGRTRVVLEVNDLSDYNSFLLPNPYRLIIDIHGKQDGSQASKEQPAVPPRKLDSDRQAETVKDRSEKATALITAAKDASAPSVPPSSSAPAGSNPVPKKIVEADNDDAVAQTEPPVRKPERVDAEPARPSTSSSDNTAARNIAKRKVADGNNDAVATLEPPDLPVLSSASPTLTTSSATSKARSKSQRNKSMSAEIETREAQPTARGDRSLIRALGLKIGRIVIDPGHGGHDTGTIGPNGLLEKDLVLDVAKRLGKLLDARMGAEVIYTRQDDTFIPLETRTAIANQEQADLFVSIHANSSSDHAARGVETYYLNFTSNADALEVAARENAVSEKSIHELQDLVKKIALKEKIGESREFAGDVQHALHNGLAMKNPGIRDRGVKKAPFIVLIGANMPSILAEISFVSNPTDAHKLETAEHRQRIAESLYRGISKYVSGLSGVKVASRMAKSETQ